MLSVDEIPSAAQKEVADHERYDSIDGEGTNIRDEWEGSIDGEGTSIRDEWEDSVDEVRLLD